MMVNNAVVHFELPADDIERASAFYEKTFGWKLTKYDMPADSLTKGEPYYGVSTVDSDENGTPKHPGAINGGLMKRASAGQVMANYINVESIEEAVESVKANGGTILMDKAEIAPGMGWVAMFKDTEGNMMGLHQMPKGE